MTQTILLVAIAINVSEVIIMNELKHRAHSVGQNAFHLVWKPKKAKDFLRFERVNKVCEGSIRLIAFQSKCKIYELQVMPDHIHLFVELPPTISVSKALQLFKGKSSAVLGRTFPFLGRMEHIWSPGKFFRSVGSVSFETIQRYIRESQGEWRFA
jgi:putative transposase